MAFRMLDPEGISPINYTLAILQLNFLIQNTRRENDFTTHIMFNYIVVKHQRKCLQNKNEGKSSYWEKCNEIFDLLPFQSCKGAWHMWHTTDVMLWNIFAKKKGTQVKNNDVFLGHVCHDINLMPRKSTVAFIMRTTRSIIKLAFMPALVQQHTWIAKGRQNCDQYNLWNYVSLLLWICGLFWWQYQK